MCPKANAKEYPPEDVTISVQRLQLFDITQDGTRSVATVSAHYTRSCVNSAEDYTTRSLKTHSECTQKVCYLLLRAADAREYDF